MKTKPKRKLSKADKALDELRRQRQLLKFETEKLKDLRRKVGSKYNELRRVTGGELRLFCGNRIMQHHHEIARLVAEQSLLSAVLRTHANDLNAAFVIGPEGLVRV